MLVLVELTKIVFELLAFGRYRQVLLLMVQTFLQFLFKANVFAFVVFEFLSHKI